MCTYTAPLFCEYNKYTNKSDYNKVNYNIFDLHTSKSREEVSETDPS